MTTPAAKLDALELAAAMVMPGDAEAYPAHYSKRLRELHTLCTPETVRWLVAGMRAMHEVRGFDDPWSHRGHEPGKVGHECRACWIMRTVDAALKGEPTP